MSTLRNQHVYITIITSTTISFGDACIIIYRSLKIRFQTLKRCLFINDLFPHNCEKTQS